MERDRPRGEKGRQQRAPTAEKEPGRERREDRGDDRDDVGDEPVVRARQEAEESSLEEQRRAVDDAYARDAEDHRASIAADEKLGTPPSFPVDPVKGENAGAPDR